MTTENPTIRSIQREVGALEVCDLTWESAKHFFQQHVHGTDEWYQCVSDSAQIHLEEFREFFGERYVASPIEGDEGPKVSRRIMDPSTLKIYEVDGCGDVQQIEFEMDIGYVTAPYVSSLLALPEMQAAGFNLLDIAVMHLDLGPSVIRVQYDHGAVKVASDHTLVNVTDGYSLEQLQSELLEAREDGCAGTEIDELFEYEISEGVLPAMAGVTFEQLFPEPEDQAKALMSTAEKIHDLAEEICDQICKSVTALLEEVETDDYWINAMECALLTSWIDEDELLERLEDRTYVLREGIELVNTVDATNVGS